MRAYTGAVARNYDAKRRDSKKWFFEIDFVRRNLDGVQTVLDCPVGTGRFLPLYRDRKIDVVGMDISADMLTEARKHDYGKLVIGSIFDLAPATYDLAVCVRLFNWLSPDNMARALKRLSRTAPRVLVSIRLRTDHPRKPYGALKLHDTSRFEEAMEDCGLRVCVSDELDRGQYGSYWMFVCGSN